ncbi:hypothetical protein KKF45_02405, partial [Patescibacteria group bacterium]|nr:hypothetical protein [Patescibacteria group bacterium]
MSERIIPPPPPPPPPDEVAFPASSSAAVVVSPSPSPTGGSPSAPTGTRTDAVGMGGLPSAPTPNMESVGVQGIAPVIKEPPPSMAQEAPPANPLNVPPEYEEYLFSSYYTGSVKAVRDAFKLTDDDAVFIGDLDRMVMAGEIDVEVYATALEDEFKPKMGDETFARLLGRLLAERLAPIGDALKPSAQEVAKTRGLALSEAAYYRIYSKPLTYAGAATEVSKAAGFSLMGGSIRERLRELIMSRVKGIRADIEVRETMMRGLDFGGLGLDAKGADAAMAAMKDILGRAHVMSEDEYSNWLSAEARKHAEPKEKEARGEEENAGRGVARTEDEEEIAKIQATMQKPAVDASSELAKAVASIYGRLPNPPTDEYQVKRLRNVVSSRLRDVRSGMEVSQLLMRPVKVGGLGLERTPAEEMAKAIEAGYTEFRDVIATEEKRKIEQQLEEQKQKVEERKHRESEEHAQWFEEKIRSRKAGETEQAKAMEGMRQLAGMTSPVDVKETKAETAKFGTLVPIASTADSVGARTLRPGHENSAPTPPTGPKVSEMAKPGVKVSMPTVELAKSAAMAPKTLDAMVYGGPKLVGLVGELKALTVSEFRRLSKEPDEAAKKIIQKVNTLGQESFERRVEGARAFQASPLQGAYMSLVAESFKTA